MSDDTWRDEARDYCRDGDPMVCIDAEMMTRALDELAIVTDAELTRRAGQTDLFLEREVDHND